MVIKFIITENFLAFFQNVGASEEFTRLLGNVHAPRFASRLHFVCESDIVAPNVEFESTRAHYPTEDGARVDSHSHVHPLATLPIKLLDRIYHS